MCKERVLTEIKVSKTEKLHASIWLSEKKSLSLFLDSSNRRRQDLNIFFCNGMR